MPSWVCSLAAMPLPAARPLALRRRSCAPHCSGRRRLCCASAAGEDAAGASKRREGEGSTWGDKQFGQKEGEDFLTELGRNSASMRIDMGARSGMIDDLFVGKFLGKQADIADGSLRMEELRTLNNIVGDYYCPPSFLDAVGLHLCKNILADEGQLKWKVPLILGIWGEKGCGKSFNIELACKAMNVQPIIMSAGELEDEWAGAPGKRIRERYRKASQTIRNSGVFSCLIINDLDAGVGRFRDTQVTVNNQNVVGTLMNLCDAPQQVSLGESWRTDQTLKRVPIIITANDLSTIYAPLLRDGRMDKFYFNPTEEDKLEMIYTQYRGDAGVSRADIAALMAAFPGQSLDFFGALRARQFDREILQWRDSLSGEEEARHGLVGKAITQYVRGREEALPSFEGLAAQATLPALLAAGNDLAREQEMVNSVQLAGDYLKVMKRQGTGGLLSFG